MVCIAIKEPIVDTLLQVIKNPITSHLPVGCKKIGTTYQSKNLVHPRELVPSDESPIAIVIGGMAHGSVLTLYYLNYVQLHSIVLFYHYFYS